MKSILRIPLNHLRSSLLQLGLFGVLLWGSPTEAAVLAYEGFDFSGNNLQGSSGVTSFGFGSNAWQQVSAGGAETQNIAAQPSGFSTGRVAHIAHADNVGGATVYGRTLAAPIVTTKSSLLQNYGTSTLFLSGVVDQLSGNDFFTLRLNTHNFGERVGIGQQTLSNSWNAFGGQWGTRTSSFNHSTVSTGVTQIAASVEFVNEAGTGALIQLYVDMDGLMQSQYESATLSGGSALDTFYNKYRAASATLTGTFLTLESLGIGVGARETTTPTGVYVDELRLATSFGEAIGVVPEPSKLWLLALSLSVFLWRRSR